MNDSDDEIEFEHVVIGELTIQFHTFDCSIAYAIPKNVVIHVFERDEPQFQEHDRPIDTLNTINMNEYLAVL